MKFPIRVIIARAEFLLSWCAHNRLPASSELPKCIFRQNKTIMPQPLFDCLYTCWWPGSRLETTRATVRDNSRYCNRYYLIAGDVRVTDVTSSTQARGPPALSSRKSAPFRDRALRAAGSYSTEGRGNVMSPSREGGVRRPPVPESGSDRSPAGGDASGWSGRRANPAGCGTSCRGS